MSDTDKAPPSAEAMAICETIVEAIHTLTPATMREPFHRKEAIIALAHSLDGYGERQRREAEKRREASVPVPRASEDTEALRARIRELEASRGQGG